MGVSNKRSAATAGHVESELRSGVEGEVFGFECPLQHADDPEVCDETRAFCKKNDVTGDLMRKKVTDPSRVSPSKR